MIDKLLAIVAPHTCCGCGSVGSLLCEHCINDIISEPRTTCMVCEKPSATNNLCRICRQVTAWENAWVVGSRAGVLKDLIDLYKFERTMAGDEILASLLLQRLPLLPGDTIVTYIPAASAHIRQRGYDTMERVARRFARDRGLKCAKLIERTQAVVQTGASRKERLTRQYDALKAVTTDHTGPILLIDDIYTTGGTLNAASRRLREVYDQPIYVAVIARQPLGEVV